ncbi:hypothetical protein KP509_10G089500 [Ceratopteris richardii]|uniref:Post-GPI attachment to proteins factor 3 n=1 Tax=Ceratopteris richardii TaxID=49495 RepID=A0A8T2TXZ5_CERRI|nr:hypothetical protein KP509_10G089500 [Ceratopteris richardii]
MGNRILLLSAIFYFCCGALCRGSPGNTDPLYRSCIEKCEVTGCVNGQCFSNCKVVVNGDSSELLQSKCPYDAWMQWNCTSECRYQCMILREAERQREGQLPVKYFGKWPFKRVLGLQEPISVAFSVANLAVHVYGLTSFLYLLHLVLPRRPQGNRGPYYEYGFPWTVFGIACVNYWIWSAVFHARDSIPGEKLHHSSAVGLLGISLIVAIIRAFSLRIEATQVMVAAPIIAFVSTHILYLNFYDFDSGWNMKVCVILGVLQLALWPIWAVYFSHPSRLKVWFVVLVGAMSMCLQIIDFSPIWGWVDACALWQGCMVPLTWLWWSFIKDDASYRTTQLLRKPQNTRKSKKSQ